MNAMCLLYLAEIARFGGKTLIKRGFSDWSDRGTHKHEGRRPKVLDSVLLEDQYESTSINIIRERVLFLRYPVPLPTGTTHPISL